MKIFQPTITGSFTASGSVFFKGLTSVSQSNVVLINTTTGQLYYTASSAIGGGGGGTVDTSSLVTTSSFNAYTGSNTAQFAGTASYANVSATAGSATTAVSASNFVITTTLRLDQTLTDFAAVASAIVGSNNLFTQSTGSFTSAFGKYTLYKGTNSRAGEFMTSWNGTTTTFTDTSVTDIGNTLDIVFSSTIVTSQLQINAVAATSAWNIKMLVTYI